MTCVSYKEMVIDKCMFKDIDVYNYYANLVIIEWTTGVSHLQPNETGSSYCSSIYKAYCVYEQ